MLERLNELKAELEKGQHQMAVLDQRRHELRDTLLRITGAIQVLEELRHADGRNSALASRPNEARQSIQEPATV